MVPNVCRYYNKPFFATESSFICLIGSSNISVGVLVTSLIGEFLVILVLLFIVKNYRDGGCRYRPRLPSRLPSSSRDDTDGEATRLCESKEKRGELESVSGTIGTDINQNGYHR